MAETEGLAEEVVKPQEPLVKPSKKPSKRGRRIARAVAGVAGGVIATVAALPGVDTSGPSIASAQGKEPTANPNVVTGPVDVFNNAVRVGVEAGINAERTAIAKLPTPTPVVVEKPIPVVVDRGPGLGDRVFDFLATVIGSTVAFVRFPRLRNLYGRLLGGLSRRFGPRPPAPPATPPAGGPPAP